MDAQGGDGGGRARLTALLGEIALLAGERSLARCPYRSARDVCTFRGECRNRARQPRSRPLCSGGPLDSRPAPAQALAAALEPESPGAPEATSSPENGRPEGSA
jgi:hypothetical protein